jgi:hypothetical protein
MKRRRSKRRLPLLALCLSPASSLPASAHAAPTIVSGVTEAVSADNRVLELSIGDSFAAVMDLDTSNAVGEIEFRPGISGDGKRYTGIAGSIEITLGGESLVFKPLFLVIGNGFIDAAGKVSQPVDLWHLHAIGTHGLLLTIGLWQFDGSAIDKPELWIPETTKAFASATWALMGPGFDVSSDQGPPRLANTASGIIESWAVLSSGPQL